jgi:hypothetical protein
VLNDSGANVGCITDGKTSSAEKVVPGLDCRSIDGGYIDDRGAEGMPVEVKAEGLVGVIDFFFLRSNFRMLPFSIAYELALNHLKSACIFLLGAADEVVGANNNVSSSKGILSTS